MTQPALERLLRNLESTVTRLGSSPAEQRRYLEKLGVDDVSDELGLEFDDYYLAVAGEVDGDPAARDLSDKLTLLDRALSNPALSWQIDDLASDPAWEEVRLTAGAALATMRDYRRRVSA